MVVLLLLMVLKTTPCTVRLLRACCPLPPPPRHRPPAWLKKASAGKVILVPTGAALEDKLLKCGIRNKNIPKNCCQVLRAYTQKKLLVDQARAGAAGGCGASARSA